MKITESMMLGGERFQGDETTYLHTIPNNPNIILGYALETPNGFACYGIRAGFERVRLEPAYVPTLEDSVKVCRSDAFDYAARA